MVIHSLVRNITVAIEDEVYRRARVKAAENSTSISAVVRKFLEEYAGKEVRTRPPPTPGTRGF